MIMIYLAKELHFPRALPPRNRREAQGCEIKITDELHHGVFFFWFFVTTAYHSKPSFRETYEFLAQSTLIFSDLWESFEAFEEGTFKRSPNESLRECARFERLKPELSAARESNECSVARSFESWEGRNFWKFLKIWMLTRTFSFSFFFFRGVWCSSKSTRRRKRDETQKHTRIYTRYYSSRDNTINNTTHAHKNTNKNFSIITSFVRIVFIFIAIS